MNGPALTSLVGGRRREGDEVVPDINPAAPDEHVATVTLAAPVYIKLGLRNAPDVYPSGTPIEPTAIALLRDRARRARLGLELLERSGYEFVRSELGAAGLAVPDPASGAVRA